jgi:hypothetical protein
MASTYLSKTFGSAGNRKTWTWSAWIKRNNLITSRIFCTLASGVDDFIKFDTSHRLEWGFDHEDLSNRGKLITNRVFRDVSAWYHIVCAVDTTNATAGNRMRIYINGVEETSFATDTNPTQNEDGEISNANPHFISSTSSAQFFDGLMAHVHFIDGTAYDASAFGETDTATGIWKPIFTPVVTYGTNGFFLKFENSASFGTDSSPNANNFTVNGTMTQTIDTPSNVFATLNALYNSGGTVTYSNGNNTLTEPNGQWKTTFSTLGASSGKYYAEFKCNGSSVMIGVADYDVTKSGIADRNFASTTFISEQGFGYFSGDGSIRYTGLELNPYGNSYGNGDIIGVALDCDNNKLYFSKNGVWQNSADPTIPNTGFSMTATNATYVFGLAVISNPVNANFGNGYFGTTAVSSAENPDDGIGIFEYEVPTGYKALCTKSINAQEYS